MEITGIVIFILAFLIFLSGFLLGLIIESKTQTSIFNGNVLVTSQVEILIDKCRNSDPKSETIKYGINLLSEGFTLNEILGLIKQRYERL